MPLFTFIQTSFSAMLLMLSTALYAQEKSYFAISSDGVKISIYESGPSEGAAIIFIHGLLGSHLNWEKQRNDPQLKQYRLIRYDLRGHGNSDQPSSAAAYTDGALWADDLAAVIDASHAQKTVLVGWSLGGAVISNYFAKYTKANIRGAVFAGGVVELNTEQIPAHPAVYSGMAAENLQTHLDAERDFLQLCFYQQPDTVSFERLLSAAALANSTMQRSVPAMSIPAEQGLNQPNLPMLFIYGQHDALVNAEASLQRAKHINPKIQSDIFYHSGHAPFWEESSLFDQRLAAFINTL